MNPTTTATDGTADPTEMAASALTAAVSAMFPGMPPTHDRYKETCALTYIGLRAAYPVLAASIRAEAAEEIAAAIEADMAPYDIRSYAAGLREAARISREHAVKPSSVAADAPEGSAAYPRSPEPAQGVSAGCDCGIEWSGTEKVHMDDCATRES